MQTWPGFRRCDTLRLKRGTLSPSSRLAVAALFGDALSCYRWGRSFRRRCSCFLTGMEHRGFSPYLVGGWAPSRWVTCFIDVFVEILPRKRHPDKNKRRAAAQNKIKRTNRWVKRRVHIHVHTLVYAQFSAGSFWLLNRVASFARCPLIKSV